MSKPTPTLSEAFAKLYSTQENAVTLRVQSAGIYIYYDFAQQLQIANDKSTVLRPFADIPRDVLVTARDRLVELGGNPPELPAETPQPPRQQAKGLNP